MRHYRAFSIRLCQENGTWSGDEAECQMRSCGPVYAPKNGRLECSSEDYVIDSECSFSCNDGFTLVGSQKRVCLPIGYWDGLPAFCKRKSSCSRFDTEGVVVDRFNSIQFQHLLKYSGLLQSACKSGEWDPFADQVLNGQDALRRSLQRHLCRRIWIARTIEPFVLRSRRMDRRRHKGTNYINLLQSYTIN